MKKYKIKNKKEEENFGDIHGADSADRRRNKKIQWDPEISRNKKTYEKISKRKKCQNRFEFNPKLIIISHEPCLNIKE